MLQEKLLETTSEYENYIKESTLDLENTEDDILQLEKELEKQRIISEGLIKTKDSNS